MQCEYMRWVAMLGIACSVALTGVGCSREGRRSDGLPPARLKSADPNRAWAELLRATTPPPRPASWETNAPSDEELLRYSQTKGLLAGWGADLSKDFYTRWPNHSNALPAQLRELDLVDFAVQLGNSNRMPQLLALESRWAADPRLNEDKRFEIQLRQLQRQMSAMEDTASPSALGQLETGLRGLQQRFPRRPEVYDVMLSVADGWIRMNDLKRAGSLLDGILSGSAPGELKEGAKVRIRQIARVGQPLSMKFKALDGREIDLERLRGKVVLVDFWATYCLPCIRSLPEVKELYARLQSKGFEILGISQDEKDEEVLQFVREHGVPWPQYRDGHQPDLKFGEQFEVELIPTLWLVDRQGRLRYLNADVGLAGKVEKLLAEP